jgi:hypothetical protein
LVRQQCFYPDCQEIRQSNQFSAYLATQEATTILAELRDTNKATSQYLTSIGRRYSQAHISDSDRQINMGWASHNSYNERLHSTSTYALVKCGMIDLWNAACVGQVQTNGDFDRGNLHKAVGVFHTLDPRLREALIAVCCKNARKMKQLCSAVCCKNARKMKQLCRDALEAQKASRERNVFKLLHVELYLDISVINITNT